MQKETPENAQSTANDQLILEVLIKIETMKEKEKKKEEGGDREENQRIEESKEIIFQVIYLTMIWILH